jgi:hypothetical protein
MVWTPVDACEDRRRPRASTSRRSGACRGASGRGVGNTSSRCSGVHRRTLASSSIASVWTCRAAIVAGGSFTHRSSPSLQASTSRREGALGGHVLLWLDPGVLATLGRGERGETPPEARGGRHRTHGHDRGAADSGHRVPAEVARAYQACIFPVPFVGGGGRHHHRHDWR